MPLVRLAPGVSITSAQSIERVRQMLTDKQPYRCHECGWRRWRDMLIHDTPDVHPEDLRTGRRPHRCRRPTSISSIHLLAAPDKQKPLRFSEI